MSYHSILADFLADLDPFDSLVLWVDQSIPIFGPDLTW
jgi:hypothetical protein